MRRYAVLVLLVSAVWVPTPAVAAPTNDPTCATPVAGTAAGATGPSATGYVLNVGDLGTVWDPAGNPQAAFPRVASHDVVAADGSVRKQVAVSFSEGLDTTEETAPPGRVVSNDGAATFPASSYSHDPGVPYIRLRNGTLLGYGFKPTAVTATTMTFPVYRSTTDGATWATGSATLQVGGTLRNPTPNGAGRTHVRPVELPDGTVLLSYYANVLEDGRGDRSMVAASADGGTTFIHRGTIARDAAGTHSYPEAAIEQLPDGRLLSVFRHHTWTGTGWALATPGWAISTNNGATWPAPQTLTVSFPGGYDPNNDTTKALLGVAPALVRMPNGVMVLSSGRPDNWVAISTNGTTWTGHLTYRNCPTNGLRFHGSTGNTDLAVVESNRVVQVGDNCDVTWACPAADSGFTVDKLNRVWRRYVDVLTPDVGKIDLATKYRLGQVSVTTDLTSGINRAFDGSTEYGSSAMKPNGAGSYVIQLDRQYTLTRLGLSLRNGRPATGRVHASTDGVTWGTPIATFTNRTHLSTEYVTTTATARYIKVDVDASADCGCAMLNEIELYSTVNSFENDPVNNRPRGFTELNQTWVTRTGTNGSSRALRISDSSNGGHAKAVWTAPTTATTRAWEFRVNPVALPNGFLFDVRGRNAAGSTVDTFHFAVRPDGSIARWAGTWITVAAAGSVPVGYWRTIRVQATTTSATILLDGEPVATGIPPSSASTALTGYSFASGGTDPVGDVIVVDDVSFA